MSRPAAVVSTVAGKQVLYAPRKLTVPFELNLLMENENSGKDWPSFGDIPTSGTSIQAGWPILTVLSAANDEITIHQAIGRLAEKVWTILGIPLANRI